MLDITPVQENFVAEVIGVDLSLPLSPDDQQALRAALDKYGVLVLPDQPLDETQQLRVAAIFGPLEQSVGSYVVNQKRPRRLEHAQLSDISNLDEKGELLGAADMRRLILLSNQLWHTDSSFKKTPASASLLSAQEIPPVGGATEFADMRAAWDALDPQTQDQAKDAIAVHDYFYSRSLTGVDLDAIPQDWKDRQPPVKQVLVRNNAFNQRRSLYLASHIREIEGLDIDASRDLLDRLMAFATRPEFVYRHRWRTNDLVIWDNRCTMHRGTNYDQKHRRALRRATVQDQGPTVPNQ